MGYNMEARGTISLDRPAVDSVWAALQAAGESGVVDTALCSLLHADADNAERIACVLADAFGSECPGDAFHLDADSAGVDVTVWAYGKSGSETEVLSIIAEHGGTGEIECVGEDGCRWRWRLADGTAHDESARTIYCGDVDTAGWIAQLQSIDDHNLDRVAVVASEAEGLSLIAHWCRLDYAENPELHGAYPPPAEDADDAAVIATWTQAIGGVRHQIRRVEAAGPGDALPSGRSGPVTTNVAANVAAV